MEFNQLSLYFLFYRKTGNFFLKTPSARFVYSIAKDRNFLNIGVEERVMSHPTLEQMQYNVR